METWIFSILFYIMPNVFQVSTGFVLGIDSTNNKDRCPDSVAHGNYLHTFREKCYEFVIYEKKYWKDARNDCKRKGGDLVVVDDALTQTFLVSTLTSMGKTKDGIWIGLTDSRHELHWEWINGEPLQGYNNWAHLQGGANFLHLTQDCAQIQMGDNGLWHDRECHLWPNKFSYICEYEMSAPDTTTTTISTTLSRLSSTTASMPVFKSTSASYLSTSSTMSSTASSSPASTSVMMTKITPAITDAFNTPSLNTKNVTTEKTTSNKITPELLTNAVTGEPYNSQSSSTVISSIHETSSEATEKTIICSELNCVQSCPNGYSGVYVGLDGCINCRCN